MLSLPRSLFLSAGRYDDHKTTLRTLAASKLVRSAVAAVLAFGILIGLFTFGLPKRNSEESATKAIAEAISETAPKYGRFHLLVPATSTNPDLCKLFTSAQILDYPTPVLINFGDPENADGYVQHLAKVQGILNYLDSLAPMSNEHGEDMVLIVDGFDVWFQLRRDVLIKRYYALNAAADARNRKTYGDKVFEAHDMRQTVVFGPDKICWPIDFSRPACWAVPQTTLADDAFGPQTAQGREEQNQPRWLNSGTIMGPAKDLQDLFRATLDEINANHTTDSDQFYMAEVFGRQEYARLQNKPGLMAYYMGLRYGEEKGWPASNITRLQPNTTGIERTEYHIGIDYESGLFQTLAFWKQYLTWTRPADSWPLNDDPESAFKLGSPSQAQYQIRLPDDIDQSDPPFSALPADQAPEGLDVYQTWADVELLYNTVTHKLPALVHFTGPKDFRRYWWQRLWFQQHAEKLRLAALEAAESLRHDIQREVIAGYRWYNAETPESHDVRLGGLGGAWSDIGGGWFSWRGLCREFEGGFYNVPGDEFRHPPPKPPEEETPPRDEPGASPESQPAENGEEQREQPPPPQQPPQADDGGGEQERPP